MRLQFNLALMLLIAVSLTAQNTIVDLLDDQVDAYNHQDVNRLVSNVTDDFIWFSQTSDTLFIEVSGKENFRANMIKYFESRSFKSHSKISKYVINGNRISFEEIVSHQNKRGDLVSSSALGIYQIKNNKNISCLVFHRLILFFFESTLNVFYNSFVIVNTISLFYLNKVFKMKLYFLITLVLLLACDSAVESEPNYPNNNWTFANATDFGVDQIKIDSGVNLVSSGFFPNMNAILLVKNGQIISEHYFRGRNATSQLPLYSAGKSKAAILVGIAYDQGLISDVNDKLLDYFPQYTSYENWSDQKDSITIEDMLTMRMGLDCGNPNDAEQPCNLGRYNHPDPIKFVLDLPMAASPGTIYLYHDASPHIAETMISGLSDMSVQSFENTFLYGPMNISNTNEFGTNALKARDMAQIGYMMINNGQWNGQQIVSKDWIDQSTTISAQIKGNYLTFEGDTASFTDGYGYYWWHNTFEINGNEYPTFFAAGNGGQYIFCFPDLDFVAVFAGSNLYDNASNYPLYMLEHYFIPAIVD